MEWWLSVKRNPYQRSQTAALERSLEWISGSMGISMDQQKHAFQHGDW